MSLNCSLHTAFTNAMSFMLHGTQPINWVYEIRNRIDVYIKHYEDKIDSREIAFLEDGLFPVMDQYIRLCEQIDEERELEEAAQLDHEQESLTTVN